MKILYLLGRTAMDGSTISFKCILEEMAKKPCEIIVLVSKQKLNQELIEYLENKGCKIEYFLDELYIYPKCEFMTWQHSFIKYPKRLITRWINMIISESQVFKLIKKHRPDIVHTNIGVLRQGLLACKKLNIPHLQHLREYQTKDFAWKIWPSEAKFKETIKGTHVVTITADILKYFGLQNSAKAFSLWDGILPNSYQKFISKKEKYFLCANRISPEKNVLDVVKAFSLIAHEMPDYKLLILGSKSKTLYVEEVQNYINSSGYADRIEIRDHVSNITDFMERATALIVASNFEGLGRMTLEAIFMGCLVIGRNTGGTKEIIDRAGGGWLFDDVLDLSNKMLLANKLSIDQYEEMIKQSQEIVVKSCGQENYADIIFNTYLKIIKD